MRSLFALTVASIATALFVAGCDSDDTNDSCTTVGGVCVAQSACGNELPYLCNSGVCCSASSTTPTPTGDASTD